MTKVTMCAILRIGKTRVKMLFQLAGNTCNSNTNSSYGSKNANRNLFFKNILDVSYDCQTSMVRRAAIMESMCSD